MSAWGVVRAHKDEIAIFLSIFALALSAVGVYLQIRETDAVAVRVVDIDSTSGESETAVVQMAISNAGNLPYLISEINMVVSSDPQGLGYGFESDGSSLVKEAPFVLEKGNMRLVKVEVPVVKVAGGSDQPRPAYLGAVITSSDVYGEVHRVELWYAAFCVESGMVFDGIVSSNKFNLKNDDRSIFSRPDANQCM